MGYHAFQILTDIINRGDNGGKYDDLIMDGSDYVQVENEFCLCSAYAPDAPFTSPFDIIQDHVVMHASESDEFTVFDGELAEIEAEIKEKFPKHEETADALAVIAAIRKRADNAGSYNFRCF